MNKNLSTQPRVLRRCSLFRKRRNDFIVLGLRYQPVAETSLGVFPVRITQTKRQVVLAPRVLEANIELAFGRAAVTRSHFVFNRAKPERNAIRFYE